MSERIKCPSCSVGLVLPESVRGSPATCPRCLAMVSVPETGREPDAIQAERPQEREGVLSCPHCGRTVEAIWITCPWCEEPLRGRKRGRNGAADLDVRRDTKRTGCLVIALAVIGGLGVGCLGVTALGAGVSDEDQTKTLVFLAVTLLALLLLAGLSTLIVFVRSRGNPGAISFRRVAVGTLALAGAVILAGLLLLLAILVFIFIVCSPIFHPGQYNGPVGTVELPGSGFSAARLAFRLRPLRSRKQTVITPESGPPPGARRDVPGFDRRREAAGPPKRAKHGELRRRAGARRSRRNPHRPAQAPDCWRWRRR
jgi:hypothetical protein